MITRNFNLYLNAGVSQAPTINVNQYDRDEQWVFTLYNENGSVYVPSTGSIIGLKSDGHVIANAGTVSDGKVVITETEQMTAAAGNGVFELQIDGETHGTANFIVRVEKSPAEGGDYSDSDLSLFQEAIDQAERIAKYGSPLVATSASQMTNHGSVYVYTGSESGYTNGHWYYWNGSAWTDGGVYQATAVETDTTLTQSGVAADAKATGDEITDLKNALTDTVFIAGGGNTFKSQTFDKVVAGRTYRARVISWDISGVTVTGGYTKFQLKYVDGNTQITLADVFISGTIADYYEFTIPSEASNPSFSIGGRVTNGMTAVVKIEDYTALKFKTDTEAIINCEAIEYNTSGKTYNLSGTTAPMSGGMPSPNIADPNFKSGFIACSAGDVFTLNLTGGTLARAYAFIQADGTIIEKSDTSAVINNVIFTAPENSAFLIIQTSGGKTCFKGTTITHQFEQLNIEQSNADNFRNLITDGYFTQQTDTGYAIKNNVNVGTVVDLTPVASENMASLVVNTVTKGMKFRIFGSGTYNYILWAWLDKNNKLISKANTWASSGASGVVIEAPQNAFKLVCSSNAGYQYGFNVQYLGATDFLAEKMDSIGDNTELVEPNMKQFADFSFSFFSDIHGGDTNFQHIIQHAEDNNLDVIINGGDTALRYLDDPDNSIDWYATDVNTSTVDILSAVGNHDVWTGAYWTKASATDIYNTFIKPLVTKFSGIVQPSSAEANGLCYYYKDYGAVRVIILNAMSGSTSVDFWDTEQATWFENVLADAKTNSKHVIVCNHSPFPKNIALRDEKSDWNSWIDYRTYSGSDGIVMKTEALDMIKAFVNGGGKLICLLTGHEHVDSILTATGYEGQFMFNTASAKYANHPDGLFYSSEDSKYYDCFNYCTVDTTHTILKVWRVGWCMDSSMKKRELFSYNYGTNKLLHD